MYGKKSVRESRQNIQGRKSFNKLPDVKIATPRRITSGKEEILIAACCGGGGLYFERREKRIG